MGRKKKSESDSVSTLQVRGDEHPIIAEVLKATAEDNDPLIGLPLPALLTSDPKT